MTGAGTAPVSEAGWWLERACSPTSRRTAAPERSARGARHSLSAPFRAVPHETTIAGLRRRDRQGSSGAALHRALPGRRRSHVPAGQPSSGEFQVSVVRYDAAHPARAWAAGRAAPVRLPNGSGPFHLSCHSRRTAYGPVGSGRASRTARAWCDHVRTCGHGPAAPLREPGPARVHGRRDRSRDAMRATCNLSTQRYAAANHAPYPPGGGTAGPGSFPCGSGPF